MSSWPLTVRHADAVRLASRNTSQLILTSSHRRGDYEVHDAQIVSRNEQLRHAGRFDLQQDPTIANIRVTSMTELRLIDLNLKIVRAAGFKTQRDFFDEWLQLRGHVDPETLVRVYDFHPAETVRLLHKRPHRGYTSDPRQAAFGEPEALSAADLEKYASTAKVKDELRRREERERAALPDRIRQLERRARDGDREAQRHLFMIRRHVDSADERRARKAS